MYRTDQLLEEKRGDTVLDSPTKIIYTIRRVVMTGG
jgi:hypothetical protein